MKPESLGSLTIDPRIVVRNDADATVGQRVEAELCSQFLDNWRGALSALAVVTVAVYFTGRGHARNDAWMPGA